MTFMAHHDLMVHRNHELCQHLNVNKIMQNTLDDMRTKRFRNDKASLNSIFHAY